MLLHKILGLIVLLFFITSCSFQVSLNPEEYITPEEIEPERNCAMDSTIDLQLTLDSVTLDWAEFDKAGTFSFSRSVENKGCVSINGIYNLTGIDVTEKIEVYKENELIYSYYTPFVNRLKSGGRVFRIATIMDSKQFAKTGSMSFTVTDKTPKYIVNVQLLKGMYDEKVNMSNYPVLASAESIAKIEYT